MMSAYPPDPMAEEQDEMVAGMGIADFGGGASQTDMTFSKQ